jgi:hypothetical protein
VNGATWQPSGGMIGGALQFDGIDDYVGTGQSLLSNRATFSGTGWVKPVIISVGRTGLWGQNDCVEFGFDLSQVYVWVNGTTP